MIGSPKVGNTKKTINIQKFPCIPVRIKHHSEMFVFKAIFVTEFFNYIWIFSTFNFNKIWKVTNYGEPHFKMSLVLF